MFVSIFALLAALYAPASASTEAVGTTNPSSRVAWQQWRAKTYDKFKKDPTSYLNAVSLNSAVPQKRLYLNPGPTRHRTSWSLGRTPQNLGYVENKGGYARLVRPGLAPVKIDPANKRYHWTLPNGAIAEVVYGASSGKVWTYIYDPDQIKTFTGFRFYPFDPDAVVTGVFTKTKVVPVSYKTVQGDTRKVYKVGKVTFPLRGKTHTLTAYNWQGSSEKLKYIAMIFTDLRAKTETYGGGRELAVKLKVEPKDGDKITLDFNRTGNFYCAHSPFWHCPTGLQEALPVATLAGEMNPLKKIARKR